MTLASPNPTPSAILSDRSYRVEPNLCRLTRGTFPFLVACPEDGWSLPCRTMQAAMRHAATLNIHDTVPVSFSAKAVEVRS